MASDRASHQARLCGDSLSFEAQCAVGTQIHRSDHGCKLGAEFVCGCLVIFGVLLWLARSHLIHADSSAGGASGQDKGRCHGSAHGVVHLQVRDDAADGQRRHPNRL